MKRWKLLIFIICFVIFIFISLIILLPKKNKDDTNNNIKDEEELVFNTNELYSSTELDILSIINNRDLLSDDIDISIINIEDNNELEIKVIDDKEYIYGIGNYRIIIKDNKKNKEYIHDINILDKTNPELEIKDLNIYEKDKVDVNSFIVSCIDNSKKDCSFKLLDSNYKELDNIDTSKSGEYNYKIKALDDSNNEIVKDVKLIIKKKKVVVNNNQNNQSNNNQSNNNQSNKQNDNNSSINNDSSNVSDSSNSNSNGSQAGSNCRTQVDYEEYYLRISLVGVKDNLGFDEVGKKNAESLNGTYYSTAIDAQCNEGKCKRRYIYTISNGILVDQKEGNTLLDENGNPIGEEVVKPLAYYFYLKPGDKVYEKTTYYVSLCG